MLPALSRNLFVATQRFSGANLPGRLAELQAVESMPRREIEEQQWQRLKALCVSAYDNVPYYRREWQQLGIDPNRFESLGDFQRLPFLTKRDVQQHQDDLRSKAIGNTPLYFGQTSGSSGNPMRFVRTQDAKARFWAAQYCCYSRYGIRMGEQQGRFYGMPFVQAKSRREKLKDLIMNRRRMTMFNLSDEQLARFSAQLDRFRPTWFNGYSTWLARYAEFVRDSGSTHRWIPLKGAVATSEVMTDSNRDLVESVFECPVIDEYGASEIGLIAGSCPDGGLHTVPHNIYLELLESEQAVATENGDQRLQEVVVTDLHNTAMPFIRYRVGDFVTPLTDPDVYCSCGRTAPLLGRISGRTAALIITPEDNVMGGMFFDYVAKMSVDAGIGLVSFSVRQTSVDRLVFRIIKDENFSEELLNFLVETTRKYVSPTIDIEFEFSDTLPRTEAGKLLSFESDLDVPRELEAIRARKASA